jgi:excisionase family DNA binding protein
MILRLGLPNALKGKTRNQTDRTPSRCPQGFKALTRIKVTETGCQENFPEIRTEGTTSRLHAVKPLIPNGAVKRNHKRIEPIGFMDRSAAAEYLGISERSIQRHKDNGDLPFHGVGGLIRYLKSDLDEFPVRFERKKYQRKNGKQP